MPTFSLILAYFVHCVCDFVVLYKDCCGVVCIIYFILLHFTCTLSSIRCLEIAMFCCPTLSIWNSYRTPNLTQRLQVRPQCVASYRIQSTGATWTYFWSVDQKHNWAWPKCLTLLRQGSYITHHPHWANFGLSEIKLDLDRLQANTCQMTRTYNWSLLFFTFS